MACVLDEYAKKGIVSVVDWDGGLYVSVEEIRSANMFAALQDCIYRAMYKHQYVAFFDIDEYFVPTEHATLIDLAREVWKKNENDDVISVTFLNQFFYEQWPDDAQANSSQLVTMKKTRKSTEFFKQGVRCKYICKPEEVVEAGNHWFWQQRFSWQHHVTLTAKEGVMHHYRKCENGKNDYVKKTRPSTGPCGSGKVHSQMR